MVKLETGIQASTELAQAVDAYEIALNRARNAVRNAQRAKSLLRHRRQDLVNAACRKANRSLFHE